MIGQPKQIIAWLLNQPDKLYEVKEYHQKRSLNANAYAWVLIGKIADALRANKEDIYLLMLKRYGQSEMVSVVSTVNPSGYFKYYAEAGRTFLQGKEFIHYKVYKRSSEMDTKEMSILIDGIISEAKNLDIEVLPPSEIERIKTQWNI